MLPPKFIVLEGIDGSGTTTQCGLVAERLRARGHVVHETREPSDGPIGKLTRSLLVDRPEHPSTVDAHSIGLLFAADRLEHVAREIEPALERGEIVLCDRYVMSAWVYQSLDCDPRWVRIINQQARWPDLTFVLDLDPAIAFDRAAARRNASADPVERFDALNTQVRLASGYAESARILAVQQGETWIPANIVRLDASTSIEKVTESIIGHCIDQGL